MNICLIGDSLTSLALAKNLINKNIKVFVYYKNTLIFLSIRPLAKVKPVIPSPNIQIFIFKI